MDLGIAGRRAAVAAASKGLGFAAAAALAAEGVHVAICSRHGRRSPRPRGTGRALARSRSWRTWRQRRARPGSSPRPVTCSVASTSSWPTPVVRRRETSRPWTTSSAYARAFELNCPLDDRDVLARPCRRCRRRSGGGSSPITSIAVRQPIPNLILSNTARAGLTGFLKTLAREVAADRRHGEQPPTRSARDRAHRRALRRRRRGRPGAAGIPAGSDRGAGRLRRVSSAFLCSESAGYRDRTRDPGRRRRRCRIAVKGNR